MSKISVGGGGDEWFYGIDALRGAASSGATSCATIARRSIIVYVQY